MNLASLYVLSEKNMLLKGIMIYEELVTVSYGHNSSKYIMLQIFIYRHKTFLHICHLCFVSLPLILIMSFL